MPQEKHGASSLLKKVNIQKYFFTILLHLHFFLRNFVVFGSLENTSLNRRNIYTHVLVALFSKTTEEVSSKMDAHVFILLNICVLIVAEEPVTCDSLRLQTA